ncbi:MAG: ribose-phosphate diphosphokinase [Pseudomonadota bacterium]
MRRVLLCFPGQAVLGKTLADQLDARLCAVAWRHFPDGESLVAIDEDLHEADVAIVASLHQADAIALPLRFAAETARAYGARSIGLVAPYLGYMRQDTRFHPGEAVSAPLFARFLESSFDWLVTVDPHLHRVRALGDLFSIPVGNVAAAPAIATWLRANAPNAVLIGPDIESRQWVEKVASLVGVPAQVLQKVRRTDRDVEVTLPDAADIQGRTPVLLDDIVSTGQTLLATLSHLQSLGLAAPICVATHAVFADDACTLLLNAGAARVVSTDTIPHPTNAIGVGALLAAGADELFGKTAKVARGDEASEAYEWFGDQEP